VSARGDVPPALLAMVRAACVALPEVHEEDAWVGVRWRIRTRTFAHVLTIHDGRPPGYARAARTEGPAVVLMFRAGGDELTALRSGGAPFFAPLWRTDEVGMFLDGRTDSGEVAELVTESYCLLAPKRLASEVVRPPG
jgi:hypothetical protein